MSFFQFQAKTKNVPNLIGKNLRESMLVCATKQLALRLLQEKEDNLLPEGTIIQQSPKPYQQARLNQSIFVITSKRPKLPIAQNFLGKKITDVSSQLTKNGISSKVFSFKDRYSAGTCIAQTPQPGDEITNKKMIIYESEGTDNPYIMPNFKNLTLKEAKKTLLEQPNISIEAYDSIGYPIPLDSFSYVITEQEPKAGSIINLKKALNVQLLATLV